MPDPSIADLREGMARIYNTAPTVIRPFVFFVPAPTRWHPIRRRRLVKVARARAKATGWSYRDQKGRTIARG